MLRDFYPLDFQWSGYCIIFCVEKCFKSQSLLIRVTPYPVSKQIIDLGLQSGSRCSEMRVIVAMTYVQSLNISLKPKDWYIVLEAIIEIEEIALRRIKGKAISQQPVSKWL